MSREQQIKVEFADSTVRLRARFAEMPIPSAVGAFDAFTEACLRFGECELRMRRAERLQTMDLLAEEASRLTESAIASNERGLVALVSVRPFPEELSASEPEENTLAAWRGISAELRAEWRDQVSQVNLDRFDAQHLVRLMDECCDAADGDGLRGLGRHLSAHLEMLDELRRSPDRGAGAASWPKWKLDAAAFVAGMTVGAILSLLIGGAPWWSFFLVALLAWILLLLITLGC